VNDDLLTMLAASAVRQRDLDADGALSPLLDELGTGLARTEKPRRRFLAERRARVIAACALGTVLVAGGTAAASGITPLNTGLFGSSHMTENDTSEWLQLDSPRLPAAIDAYGKAVPLPPGGDWSYAKRTLPTKQPSLMQVTGVKSTLAMQSACQWEYYWLDSRRVHDAKGTRLAARTIEALPTWPIFTAVDGGGLVASYQKVADGVRRGNAAPLQQEVAANCTPAMWPGAAK
jgi:hypothetical protein